MIARRTGTEVRTLTDADVDEASAMIVDAGWTERRVMLRFVAGHPACRAFVAVEDDRIVGTAIGTVNGQAGWIGVIFVDPAVRGRGLGSDLTDIAIEAVESAGCRTLVLTATELGRPIYERLGFAVEVEYVTLGPPDGAAAPDGRWPPRAFRPADLGRIIELDRDATGEDRSHLLEALASPATTRCVMDGHGAVAGFRLRPPWGGGATIAAEPEAAIALLDDARTRLAPGATMRAGVPSSNGPALATLEARGWTVVYRVPRMVRGAPLAWEPAHVWGQFGFAFG
jgi:GNAT superfamily N-acetyltransferase